MTKVDETTFEAEVLKATLPVVVDFYAEWCGPCKKMEPILGKVAQDYDGKVKVCKINTDENRQVAAHYKVRSLPTLVLFRGGQPVDSRLGFQNEMELTKLMEEAMASVG